MTTNVSAETTFTTNSGDYLVIWITGAVSYYIAEVVKSDPLVLKVEESGFYSKLKSGDFIVLADKTVILQQSGADSFLESVKESKSKVLSGLKSLGIEDGKLKEITL